jgi:hypothetical protein
MHSNGPLGERTLQTDYEYLCRARSPNGPHVAVSVVYVNRGAWRIAQTAPVKGQLATDSGQRTTTFPCPWPYL